MDREIMGGLDDIKVAEGIVGHKWNWDRTKYLNPSRHNPVSPYYDESSVLEHDIQDSQKN